jgi:hypothetical protein
MDARFMLLERAPNDRSCACAGEFYHADNCESLIVCELRNSFGAAALDIAQLMEKSDGAPI